MANNRKATKGRLIQSIDVPKDKKKKLVVDDKIIIVPHPLAGKRRQIKHFL